MTKGADSRLFGLARLGRQFGPPPVWLDGLTYQTADVAIGAHASLHQEAGLAVACDGELLPATDPASFYRESGLDFARCFHGKFAIALHDTSRQRLVLARDHLGLATLYWTKLNGWLVFASDIRTILDLPGLLRSPDLVALDQMMLFPGYLSPRTMFDGIHSVPAGHCLVVDGNGIQAREYWDVAYPEAIQAPRAGDEHACQRNLLETLAGAVHARSLRSGVVGVYLSGGLDSAIIAALLRRCRPREPICSFALTLDDGSDVQQRRQLLIADHLRLDHQVIRLDWSELAPLVERAVDHAAGPLRRSVLGYANVLCSHVRERGVSSMLTGEGADELFAGYAEYRLDPLRRAEGLRDEFEDDLRQRLWSDRALFYERDYLAARETVSFLYAPRLRAALREVDCLRRELVNKARIAGRHPVHQRSYLDLKFRTAERLLGDKAADTIVPCRHPFLDPSVVECAQAIPPEFKLNGVHDKWILRRAASSLLPPEISGSPKDDDFNEAPSPLLAARYSAWIDSVYPATIRDQGYFDEHAVERLKALCRSPRSRGAERELLSVVMTFTIFVERFGLPAFSPDFVHQESTPCL